MDVAALHAGSFRRALAAMAIVALPLPAFAQNRCEQYVGEIINPVTFSAAVAPYARLTARSEFESTAEYEVRLANALGASASAPLIIRKSLEGRFIEYNADTRKLRISAMAFGHHLNAWMVFIGTPYWSALQPDANANVDVVLSDPEVLIGSYAATNSFGVRTQVKKFRRVTSAVFDHAANGDQADLFPTATAETGFAAGEIAMTPAQAKALEPVISLAFVVVPKSPYLITGSRIASTPTLDTPKEISENYSVLVADIQCGLVLDGTHKVLAAYGTR